MDKYFNSCQHRNRFEDTVDKYFDACQHRNRFEDLGKFVGVASLTPGEPFYVYLPRKEREENRKMIAEICWNFLN